MLTTVDAPKGRGLVRTLRDGSSWTPERPPGPILFSPNAEHLDRLARRGRQLARGVNLMFGGPVWLHGVDDVPLDALEWWRVVAVQGTCGSRLLFVDEGLAESFARLLVADCCQTVLLEHWREGERTDARLVVSLAAD